jgi:site-specific recombinase XerD
MTDNQVFSATTETAAAALVTSTRPTGANLMALDAIVEQARQYASVSKAPATRRAYQSDWQSFTAWCSEHGLLSMPATPGAVATYATYMASKGRKAATIQRSLVSISQAHQIAHHESPTKGAIVRETMKGIRRSLGTHQIQKAPVMPAQLKAMVAEMDNGLLAIRNAAMVLVGFSAGLRRSELTALDVSDVEFCADGLVIHLRRSKTDQDAKGREVGIPYGCTPQSCPVRSLRRWLDAAGITDGPIFRPVGRWGRVGVGRLDDRAVARVVQHQAASLGLDPSRYGGHSLRAGLATAAARAGHSERSIMQQTGHRSEAMVRRYIRQGTLFQDNAAAGLL